MLPDAGRVPASDPFADVAELLSPPPPPALAELIEYIDDDDIRFMSLSIVPPRGLNEASGSGVCLAGSAITPAASLGVPISSMAKSRPGLPVLSVQASEVPDSLRFAMLKTEEGLEIIIGLEEVGGGIEMLARSAFASDVPGSACRPFLLILEGSVDAKESLWEAVRVFNGSGVAGSSGSASVVSTAVVLGLLVSGCGSYPIMVAADNARGDLYACL
jgi:hypothetical protein